jgi:LCP family protein required for cell wall assembly
VKRRSLAVLTGVLVPVVLFSGLVASASMGGAGVRLGRTVVQVHKVQEAHFNPMPGEPVFVLIVGNDARPGDLVSRGDALQLVGVNPGTGQGTILNIPRDVYVPIPGRGTDKINAAHTFGGPVAQANAVAAMVGVPIPYVISTGFDGFMQMVDELGGVDVDVPMSMADPASGAYFSAGTNQMLGGEALAFARNRNVQGGDFTRSHNQGLLILAALAKLRAAGPSAANVIRWLGVLLRNATFDGATVADLYRLGRLALSIDPANVRNVTMPGVTGNAGGASVVFKGAGADSLFADFRDNAVLDYH